MDEYILLTTWGIGDGEIAFSVTMEFDNLHAALFERDKLREQYSHEGYNYEVYKKVTPEDY